MMSNIPLYQIIAEIKQLVILHPQFQKAYEIIINAFEMNCNVGIPQHLICIGESGTGKSTLKEQIAKSLPPTEQEDRLIVPVVMVDTPAKPTVKNLAETVLIKLGDFAFHKGSTTDKTNRIHNYFRRLGVKLIIIDELQHFIDHGKVTDTLQLSDWLKGIIDNTKVSTVLMGLNRCEHLIQVNEQLRRRFSQRINLRPFVLPEDQQSFVGVLVKLQEKLHMLKPIDLSNSELIKRIYFATNGIIDYMVKLLLGAFEIALDKNLLAVTQYCLEQAFTERIWIQGKEQLNPFNHQFKWQRLDKKDMPFYKQSIPKQKGSLWEV